MREKQITSHIIGCKGLNVKILELFNPFLLVLGIGPDSSFYRFRVSQFSSISRP